MKLMIVDDEAPARQRLRGLISELGGDYEVTAEAENGEQAVALSEAHPVDLVFMDIHMPGMDGLEAAAHISRQEPPPAIIFGSSAEFVGSRGGFEANDQVCPVGVEPPPGL